MSKQKHPQFDDKQPRHSGPVQFQIEEKPLVTALILIPTLHRENKTTPPTSAPPPDAQREEAHGLAKAIDLDVKAAELIPLEKIKPATLFGSGKVEELKHMIKQHEVELVIIDHPLSPGQQRNLEKQWHVKILDRTGLILEIFGRRAATREGRLQVELAHLTYQKSRLVRSWTHLERQRGGAGFLGGPGETQLEADKRQLQTRIINLTKELERVKKTRTLHRKKRAKVPYPIIALVGYTNAGKSTLFNRLTGAKVMAKDQLFATLDPTMRAIHLPNGTKAILSDTVGFISNLPTQLIAAFRATLEEVLEADIILHVEDVANPNRAAHAKEVQNILKELGVNQENTKDVTPQLTVWNKIDQLPSEERDVHAKATEQNGNEAPYLISAHTGEGIETLLTTIETHLRPEQLTLTLNLAAEQGAVLNWLYKNAEVEPGQSHENGTTDYKITIAKHLSGRLQKLLAPKSI